MSFFVIELSGLTIAIVCAAYFYLKYVAFNYWSSRNVPFVRPEVPFGNLWPMISAQISHGEFFRDKYLEFKEHPIFGVYSFHKPTLVVNDPELVKIVLTKEFQSFHDRGLYYNEKTDPLSGHLVFISGNRWKFLRTKLTPTFTSSKMKQIFFTIKESCDTLVSFVAKKIEENEIVEFKDLVARFTTDVVASVAFGLRCNSIENPDVEFRKLGRKACEPKRLKNLLTVLVPKLAKLFNMRRSDKDVSQFFINLFTETVEHRKANNVVRQDFLNLVMDLMDKGYVEDDGTTDQKSAEADNERITMLEGAAQAFVFWIAGFETSSSTMTYCLYELALHQDIQDKVADEVNSVLQEFGGLTYESVNAMPYLHKVVSETLRKYPPIPMLNRECTKAFDLPGTGLRVEEGTPIVIPTFGLHRDPEIYPEPDKFDPERFNDENIAERHPYAYLPFGEGPRKCIGMRFGLVQTKVGLLSLISKYRFKPGPKLLIPLQVDKGTLLNTPRGDMMLKIEER